MILNIYTYKKRSQVFHSNFKIHTRGRLIYYLCSEQVSTRKRGIVLENRFRNSFHSRAHFS